MAIKGAGHQALCDVAIMLPHTFNVKLLQNSLGTPSHELARAVNEVVLGYLRNEGVLGSDGGERLALATIANTIVYKAAASGDGRP
eukprot:5681459-Prymnesium_polylepis.1